MRKYCPCRSAVAAFLVRTALVMPVCATILPAAAFARDQDQVVSRLFYGNWLAGAFSHRVGGTLCWVTGPDGSLRLEVRRGPRDLPAHGQAGDGPRPAALEPLLDREGEGWTMVLGPDDAGTLNAWGREWRSPPAGLVQMVRLVTRAVEDYPDPPATLPFGTALGNPGNRGAIPRPHWAGGGKGEAEPAEDTRYELAPLDLDESSGASRTGFRAAMTARGRGTGGVGEIVTISWKPLPDSPGRQVAITSSRRPGTLVLEGPASRRVETPPPELFLPLWPLAQFFRTR